MTAAFQQVSHSVALSCQSSEFSESAAILHDQVVWVTTPVRIDFAGGWSDTPPICTEQGGTGLNAAITLNGLYPIQVMAKLNSCNTIRLSSIDLGERQELTKTAQVLDHHDPHDWATLAKAALILSGIVPDSPGKSLKKRLELFGGGLDLTIFSSLPKGSGMGTSSILGAAVLACLDRVLGVPFSSDRLIFMTSMLEQRMSTGGGWQDQVGGVLGGVKIVYADSALVPDPRIHYLPSDIMDPSTNGGTTLLYYTGITRLAKNILEQVVGRYLNRNRGCVATLTKIKGLTAAVAETLSRKDMPAFGRLVDRAWQLNKQLDPNSTNDEVEKLFARIEPHVYGAKLLGAGGGGFMFMVCKSPEDAMQIRNELNADPPNDRSRFFDFNVNNQGLVVTVC
jgi:galactokinase/mevalonate kinase-like predicted kinase